jgi:hypothetical protein
MEESTVKLIPQNRYQRILYFQCEDERFKGMRITANFKSLHYNGEGVLFRKLKKEITVSFSNLHLQTDILWPISLKKV